MANGYYDGQCKSRIFLSPPKVLWYSIAPQPLVLIPATGMMQRYKTIKNLRLNISIINMYEVNFIDIKIDLGVKTKKPIKQTLTTMASCRRYHSSES